MKRPTITPGQWSVSPRDSADVISNRAGTNPIVAECPGYKAEREANARAIAALPDLLSALENMYKNNLILEIHRLSEYSKRHGLNPTNRELIEAAHEVRPIMEAKAALIKAGYTF